MSYGKISTGAKCDMDILREFIREVSSEVNIKVMPRRLSGTIKAVSSKAHTHRLLIASALCEDSPEIAYNNTSQDVLTTRACLEALKASLDKPLGGVSSSLECGESGATLRFLLPVAAALKDDARFLYSDAVQKRSLMPLIQVMKKHGCAFYEESAPDTATKNATTSDKRLKLGDLKASNSADICQHNTQAQQWLLSVKGSLQPGIYTLSGGISSQSISGLLFALPLLSGDSEIHFTSPIRAASYVDMTVKVLKSFGVDVEATKDEFVPIYKIPGNQKYSLSCKPSKIKIEGDWLNGAVWLAAGAINGAVSVLGLDYRSYQAEKEITEIIKNFSGFANPSVKGVVTRTKDLFAAEVDAANIPDLVPIISVLGCAAYGKTIIKNAAGLSPALIPKRENRLDAVCKNLSQLGANIERFDGTLIIRGQGKLKGGTVSSGGDHRLAMALVLAASICEEPVVIKGADAVEKSYPHFFEDFKSLGGEYKII